jgi:hypothetical protein
MRSVRIFVFGIIGLLLGIGLFNLVDYGYFERWKKLPDSSYHSLNLFISENWQNNDGTKFTKPCNYSSPEFFFLSNYPRDIADCVQIHVQYAEGAHFYSYVLEQDGYIWEWNHLAINELSEMTIFSLSGSLIGIGIAIWVNRSLEVKRQLYKLSGERLNTGSN